MQTISIPSAPPPNVALPANAASAPVPKDTGAPRPAVFAGMIHEFLQRSQAASESAGARPAPAKESKLAKRYISANAAPVVVASSAAPVVVLVAPMAGPAPKTSATAVPEVTPKTVTPVLPTADGAVSTSSGAAPQISALPQIGGASRSAQAAVPPLLPVSTAAVAASVGDGKENLHAPVCDISAAGNSAFAISPSNGSALPAAEPERATAALPAISGVNAAADANSGAAHALVAGASEKSSNVANANGPSAATNVSAPILPFASAQSSGAAVAAQSGPVPAKAASSAAAAAPQISNFQPVGAEALRTLQKAAASAAVLAKPDTAAAPSSLPVTVPAPQSPSKNAASADPVYGALTLTSLSADHGGPLPLTTSSLKSGAPDSLLLRADGASPKVVPAPENASNKQDSASQHDLGRGADPANAAPPASAKSNDVAAFDQSLGAVASTRTDIAPAAQVVDPQAAGIASGAGGHNSASISETPAATPAASTAAIPTPNPQLDPTAANHFVSEAQLLQNAGHSEMRIAMQTDKLGAIELHARMAGDEVGAAITVEKRDAHAALAVELPALQQSLSDKMLRVEQVVLIHGPLHSTAGNASSQQFGGQAPGHDRQPGNAGRGGGTGSNFGNFDIAQSFTANAAEIFDSQGRLSVHA